MKHEIVSFIREAFKRYNGLEAIYIPDVDCYSVTFRGRAIQNFTTQDFFSFPKKQRMREWGIFIHLALAINLQGAQKNQYYLPRRNGIQII